MRLLRALAAIVWASPWTLLGLLLGCLALATSGRCQRAGRVLEFWGGFAALFLRTFPLVHGASAVTFGHTVLARDLESIERTRDHERVHVRQYERWGLFFVPAYLLHWCRLWWLGKNPYLDNPFEREAFDKAG